MKNLFRLIGSTTLIALLVAFVSASVTNDFLQQLGLTEQEADNRISQGFLSGFISTRALAQARKIPVANHPYLVTSAVQYARKFTERPSFFDAYNQLRQQQKPVGRDLPLTPDAFRQTNIDNAAKALEESETAFKNASADMKPMLQELVSMAKETLKEAKKPDNLYQQLYKDNYPTLLKEAEERNAVLIAEWNRQYPEKLNDFIKIKLEQFMYETRDINFDAETQWRQGKQVFVQSAYENKSKNWKLGFRMGGVAIATARKAIQLWLDDLTRKP